MIEHKALSIECMAVLIDYRAVSREFWVGFIESRAVLIECRVVLIEYL